MLEHLIGLDLEPEVCQTMPMNATPVSQATGREIVAAQNATLDWLESLGLTQDKVGPQAAANTAREVFANFATQETDVNKHVVEHNVILEMRSPEVIRHATAMLTAYDWQFVDQAQKIRSYVVTRLMEEAERADKAGDRIKALTALGKVTEVGLFTDKVEIKKTGELSDSELDAKIKERLDKLRGVVDALPRSVQAIDDAPAKQPD